MRTSSKAAIILACSLQVGCAVHYFDSDTNTEHIWGIGHMKMRIADAEEGVQAVVRGNGVIGFSVGRLDQLYYLTAGWHRTQRLDAIADNTCLRFEWPSSDFAKVRIGTNFPPMVDDTSKVGRGFECTDLKQLRPGRAD